MENLRLPKDIMMEILSWLPVKSLLRFKSLCKVLSNSMENPVFVKAHLNRAVLSKNYYFYLSILKSNGQCYFRGITNQSGNETKADTAIIDHPLQEREETNWSGFVGYCNGLVCLRGFDGINHCLWNPCTKEFKELLFTPPCRDEVMFGFGYNPTIDDYKVVQIDFDFGENWFNDDYDANVVGANVYTLGTSSWKSIGNIPEWIPFCGDEGEAQLVNGVLHWLVNSALVWVNGNYHPRVKSIVAFDLMDDEFKQVPLPDSLYDGFRMNLVTVEGCLCVLSDFNSNHVQAWVMKQYGVKDSWSKLFTISQTSCIRQLEEMKTIPFSEMGDGIYFSQPGVEIVREADRNNLCQQGIKKDRLVLYDWKHETPKILMVPGIPKASALAASVGSLVSLNSCTYVGQQSDQKSKLCYKYKTLEALKRVL